MTREAAARMLRRGCASCLSSSALAANERLGAGREWSSARRDAHLELFGIFPSISVIRARLADTERHACHAGVDDAPLREWRARERAGAELRAAPSAALATLVRWPTTMGGWKREKLPGGRETWRYKASPSGRFQWRELLAAPTWFPPPTTPDQELLRLAQGGGWSVDTDAIGPGYRSAYGLVALLQHRRSTASDGSERLIDTKIRTHGSGNYRSVLRGSSHGCHRLLNHLAVRLGGFLLRHVASVRHGQAEERYSRVLHREGQSFVLSARGRGYRFELLQPVTVDVRSVPSPLRSCNTERQLRSGTVACCAGVPPLAGPGVAMQGAEQSTSGISEAPFRAGTPPFVSLCARVWLGTQHMKLEQRSGNPERLLTRLRAASVIITNVRGG